MGCNFFREPVFVIRGICRRSLPVPITSVSRIRRLHLSLNKRSLAIVAFGAVVVCALASSAFADAGIILNESLDTSVARITGSGHSAVYLSNICPDDSPVKMRLCRPGEQGSVISNDTTLGEDQPYEWNIVPLGVYLYGVEDPQDRPLLSSKDIKSVLEERYREQYLATICTGAVSCALQSTMLSPMWTTSTASPETAPISRAGS